MTDFIPNGWTVLDSVYGDLNKDNTGNLAVIFQDKDSILHIAELDGYTDTTHSKPRILALFIYNNSSWKSQLIEQTNSFILTHNNPHTLDIKELKIFKTYAEPYSWQVIPDYFL